MKIREIFHDDSTIWKQLPHYFRTILNHIHDLQIQVNELKGFKLATGKKHEYVTPNGIFPTKTASATANNISLYRLNKYLNDPNNKEYLVRLQEK